LHPSANGELCPIGEAHFEKGGCTTPIATSKGARLRHQLDRRSQAYKQLYAKRTMVERMNSQAEALGILRPKLRRGRAIANRNTLLYVRLHLLALSRLPAAAEEGRSASESLALRA